MRAPAGPRWHAAAPALYRLIKTLSKPPLVSARYKLRHMSLPPYGLHHLSLKFQPPAGARFLSLRLMPKLITRTATDYFPPHSSARIRRSSLDSAFGKSLLNALIKVRSSLRVAAAVCTHARAFIIRTRAPATARERRSELSSFRGGRKSAHGVAISRNRAEL